MRRVIAFGLVALGCSPATSPASAEPPRLDPVESGSPAQPETPASPEDPPPDAPEEASPEPPAVEPEPDQALAALVGAWSGPDREVVPAAWGAVRSSAEGLPLVHGSGATAPPVALRVLDSSSAAVRVLARATGSEVLVWIDRADLRQVVVREVHVTRSRQHPPADADARVGYTLARGAQVEIVEREDGFAKIDLPGAIPVRGWIAEDALGDIYDPGRLVLGQDPADRWLEAKREVAMRAGKSGKRMATIPRDEAVLLVGRVGASHRIIAHQATCEWDRIARGVVPTDALREPTMGGLGTCGFPGPKIELGPDADTAPRRTVSKGRWLLEPVSGQPVGRTTETAEQIDEGEGLIRVGTYWGPIVLALAPEGWAPSGLDAISAQ